MAAQLTQRLAKLERSACVLGFTILVIALFADVVAREVTGSGLVWARELAIYANLLVVLMGFGLASEAGSHLRPRFSDSWLPERFDPWIVRVQEGLMALFCLGFALLAADVVWDTWQQDERSLILRWPVWPFQALLPLTFAIGALRHGLFAVFPDSRPTDGDTGS